MGLKEFVFGHKRYCVTDNKDCIDHCFPTKAEAMRYKNENCGCTVQKQVQRRPFKCPTTKCGPKGEEVK